MSILRFCTVVACLGLFLSLPSFAGEPQEADASFDICEKTYVFPNQLKIDDKYGILVQFHGAWYQTEALFTDSNGLFIRNLRKEPCPDGYSECPKCTRCVSQERAFCPYCGGPIYRLRPAE
jgi:hypothetical protein